MIRFLDIIIALLALLILSPFFIIAAIIIKLTSKGPIFFLQQRIGKHGIEFTLIKFRTMYINRRNTHAITVGARDNRITPVGYYFRKLKVDELPQLINVLIGNMSLVGPRPELKKFVDLYTDDQRNVLNVLPGITDYASIYFRNENELLANKDNPELFYIEHIMPQKIKMNQKFIQNPSIGSYFKILWLTAISVIKQIPPLK